MKEGSEETRKWDDTYDPWLAEIGMRIRVARRRAKLRQADVARAIGSGQSYVFRIEAGEMNLTLKTLARIAEAVGVMPRDLLPPEQSGSVPDTLQIALRDLARVTDQLRELHDYVLDDGHTPTPRERSEVKRCSEHEPRKKMP